MNYDKLISNTDLKTVSPNRLNNEHDNLKN